jgi:hypothetical protein
LVEALAQDFLSIFNRSTEAGLGGIAYSLRKKGSIAVETTMEQ